MSAAFDLETWYRSLNFYWVLIVPPIKPECTTAPERMTAAPPIDINEANCPDSKCTLPLVIMQIYKKFDLSVLITQDVIFSSYVLTEHMLATCYLEKLVNAWNLGHGGVLDKNYIEHRYNIDQASYSFGHGCLHTIPIGIIFGRLRKFWEIYIFCDFKHKNFWNIYNTRLQIKTDFIAKHVWRVRYKSDIKCIQIGR